MVIAVVSGGYEMVPLDSGWGLWYSGADRGRDRIYLLGGVECSTASI